MSATQPGELDAGQGAPPRFSAGAWLRERLELGRHGAVANLRPMEGLRGFAVFLVFLVHYMSWTLQSLKLGPGLSLAADTIHSMGNVGVDLFFVLSGFLIYGALMAREQAFMPFIGRRVRRIYPAFLAVFALYVLLSWLMPAASKIPAGFGPAAWYLLANLLLLPGLFPIEPLNTVAWSLSYEFFYYLLIPVVVGLLGLRRRGADLRWWGTLAVGALMALGFALFGGPVRMLMFVAGILLYEAQDRPRAPAAMLGWLGLLAGLVLATVSMPGWAAQALRFVLLGLCFFVLCLAAFRRPGSLLARVLSWEPMRWLGNMSYSYYLIHGLALQAFFKVAAHLPQAASATLSFWTLLPLSFAFSLVVAFLLYLWVERPYSLLAGRR